MTCRAAVSTPGLIALAAGGLTLKREFHLLNIGLTKQIN